MSEGGFELPLPGGEEPIGPLPFIHEPAPPPTEPKEPEAPTEPTEPTEPIAPGGPAGPTEPTAPAPPVAPLPGPGGGGGIGDLSKIAVFLLILGLLLLTKALTDFLNWLHRFFFPNSKKQLPKSTTILQPLSNAMGALAAGIDAEIAQTIRTLEQDAASLARLTNRLAAFDRAIAARIATIERQGAASDTATAVAHSAANQAASKADAAQQAAANAAAAGTVTTGRLQHETRVTTEYLTRLIEPELERLRSRIGTLEKGSTSTWSEIERIEGFFDDTAIAALVAGGIASIGGAWIGCEAMAVLGEEMCGLGPQRVGNLLAALLALAALVDPCAIIAGLTALAESGPAQDALGFLASTATDLLFCTTSERASPLNTAYYSPGRLTALGAPGVVGV